jgi:transposase-like protein
MSGRHGDQGGGVLDASIDMREAGDAEHPAAVIALATINGSGQRRCLRCQGDRLHRHGKGRSGMQRWRCRHCQHTFSSTTGTMLAGLHAPAKLGIVVSDMLSAKPSSCRRLARALQLSKMTIWAWRQKVSRAFAAIELSLGKDDENARRHRAAQSAVTVLRESRKASREWVDHQRDPARCPAPDRRRWVDYRMHDLPLPRRVAPFLVTVSFDASGLGRHERGRMPQEADTLAATTMGIDMPLKCDQGGGAQARSADPHAACQPACVSANTSARTAGQLACRLDHSDLVDHFQTFVSVFSGPATKHLGGYLAWFDARLRASDDRRTRQVWRATPKVLTTRSPTRFWDMLNIGGPTQRQRRAAA